MVINISSRGKWPANILSNFALTPFWIGGVECASAEGFIQALKFPDPAVQYRICRLFGREAKRAGKYADEQLMLEDKLWWQGEEHRRGSPNHYELVRRALVAKFRDCERAQRALIATKDEVLEHNLGYESPRTSLPAQVFVRILEDIRATAI